MFDGLDEMKRQIDECWGSLIEIGSDSRIKALHRTVKEFFFSNEAGDLKIVESSEHKYLADTFLGYLLDGFGGNLGQYLAQKILNN